MAETEKILIEVEIDNEAAKKNEADLIGLIERQRQELALRRKELKKSNGTNKEAAKRVGELTRSIQSNSTQLRTNQKDLKANDNSINGLRASVGRLTAERNNLDVSDKKNLVTFNKLTTQIKGQSDQLKVLEKSVGDTRRNVGNYTESIIEASGASGLFGGAIGQLKGGFQALKLGLSSLTLGFKGLRGAIIATGIGALVLGLVSLIAFLKTTRKGVEFLEKSMMALESVGALIVDGFAKVGETIFDAFSNPKQTLIDLGDALVTNIINRFKSISVFIEAIALAFEGEWSASLKKATDAAIQLGTGVEDGTDKIEGMVESVGDLATGLVDAANAGFKMGASAIQLREAIDDLNLSIAKTNLESQKQLAISADASRSNEERIKAARASIVAEEQIAQARVDIAKNQRKLLEIEIAGIGEADEEQRRKRKQLEAQELQALATFETTTKRARNRLNTLVKQLDKEKADAAKAQEDKELEERQEFLDTREQQIKDSIAKRKAGEEAWSAFLKGEEAERTRVSKAASDAQRSTFAATANALGAVSGALEESSAAYKAFAIAQASISAYLAANLALASPPFTPANFLTAGAAIATGLVNVGKIAGFAKGGIVGDGVSINRSNGDNRLITAKTGEAILNKSQQSRIGHGTLARAGVPGFATGGVVGSQLQASSISSSVNSQQDLMNQIKNIPAPVLDYKEFTRFTNTVSLKESRANV